MYNGFPEETYYGVEKWRRCAMNPGAAQLPMTRQLVQQFQQALSGKDQDVADLRSLIPMAGTVG